MSLFILRSRPSFSGGPALYLSRTHVGCKYLAQAWHVLPAVVTAHVVTSQRNDKQQGGPLTRKTGGQARLSPAGLWVQRGVLRAVMWCGRLRGCLSSATFEASRLKKKRPSIGPFAPGVCGHSAGR